LFIRPPFHPEASPRCPVSTAPPVPVDDRIACPHRLRGIPNVTRIRHRAPSRKTITLVPDPPPRRRRSDYARPTVTIHATPPARFPVADRDTHHIVVRVGRRHKIITELAQRRRYIPSLPVIGCQVPRASRPGPQRANRPGTSENGRLRSRRNWATTECNPFFAVSLCPGNGHANCANLSGLSPAIGLSAWLTVTRSSRPPATSAHFRIPEGFRALSDEFFVLGSTTAGAPPHGFVPCPEST